MISPGIIARFIVSTVGTAFVCYIEVEDLASHPVTHYLEMSASVSFKAFGIIIKVNTG